MEINRFLSAIKSGLFRGYRYRVTVAFPPIVANSQTISDATTLAKSAVIPASTLGELVLTYGGREIPLPGDRSFAEMPLTFIVTNDTAVRDAWELWSEIINGSESNTAGVVDPDDYLRDVTLEMLGPQNEVLKTYVLQNAWPKEVGQIQLSQESRDASVEFEVSLRYLQVGSNLTR